MQVIMLERRSANPGEGEAYLIHLKMIWSKLSLLAKKFWNPIFYIFYSFNYRH